MTIERAGRLAERASTPERLFIVYDERAILLDTTAAAVLCTAPSLKEARRDVREMFPRGVIYRYDVSGQELINETWIEGPFPP